MFHAITRRPVRKSILFVGAALLLGGCSVATAPRVASFQMASPVPAALRIEATGPAAEPLAAALAEALRARGKTVTDTADYTLLVAASQRPARLGLTLAPSPAPDGKIDWLSTPRKRSLFDSCAPQRFEAVISGRGAAQAAPSLHMRGGFDYCATDPASIAAQARQFAERL